jgi:hypothetical protein
LVNIIFRRSYYLPWTFSDLHVWPRDYSLATVTKTVVKSKALQTSSNVTAARCWGHDELEPAPVVGLDLQLKRRAEQYTT